MKKEIPMNIKNCIASNIVLWGLLSFYLNNKYYRNFLEEDTKSFLLYFSTVYSFIFSAYYLKSKTEEKSKTLKIILAIKKIIRSIVKNEELSVEKKDKNLILFLIVKIFFFPLLANFLVGNLKLLLSNINNWKREGFGLTIDIFNSHIYYVILMIIFTIDVFIFLICYMFESKKLKNTVRSVEPTALGWFVALICYPPINNLPDYYLSWYPDSYENFSGRYMMTIANMVLLITWMIYLWATFALGFKCANLCNRGIVKRGPYRYIRHPAYTFKNIGWWIATIPVLNNGTLIQSGIIILNALFWSFIYYLRAYTEERHLKSDPEYIKYMEEVPDRFIYGYNKFKNKYLLRNNTTKP